MSISIEKECGNAECHKNFEKTVNGVNYSISIDIKDAQKVEMGNVVSTVKINDLTEEFTETVSLSEIGILENGLIAIRNIPVYGGKFNTDYYDGNKLIETISSKVLNDYPITQNFGNYDECIVPKDNVDEEDEDDFNQELKLYSFIINDNKVFSKNEIGTIENTFCTAQT